MQALRWIKRLLARTVGDQLDSPKQAATAEVADMGMIAEARLKRLLKVGAACAHRVEQAIALDHLLHRQGCCGRDRVADVRVTVLEGATAIADRRDDALMGEQRADGLIAAA